MGNDTTHAAPSACANCATTLRGQYCHHCGQSTHNPLRDVRHAIEDVFESFWHLDGRVFRTLADLLLPGRVARNYIGGQRVRYVAPLRLFVVLSVLTFFIAQYVIHFGSGQATARSAQAQAPHDPFARTADAQDVEAVRTALLNELQLARDAVPVSLASARIGLDTGIDQVNRQAAARLAQLRSGAAPIDTTPAPEEGWSFTYRGKSWHAVRNPVVLDGLPESANRWLNRQILRAQTNASRIRQDPELMKHAFLSAVPSALFVLVPVLALLLRVAYLGSGRGYLEHLTVALYSHAFLCLALLALMLLNALEAWIGAYAHGAWIAWPIGLAEAALWLWMPAYLWLTQKRCYGEGRALTTLKYLLVGSVYASGVGIAALWLLIASLVRL